MLLFTLCSDSQAWANPDHMPQVMVPNHYCISRVERKTGVSQMVVFPQT